MENSIYPLTIILDRYGGVYSGGIYTAWNLDAQHIPWEVRGSDPNCMAFWENFDGIVGLGKTPREAQVDLYVKLNQNK